jgi:recombination protein RecT
MNDQTAVATREETPVAKLQSMLQARAHEINAALPSHISPDKFNRTVVTAATQNPDLLTADRGSFILACYKAAQDGLLPDGREAAFVVFKNRVKEGGDWVTKKVVQYMPMVYGLRKKILQSAEVSALEVGVVYRRELEEGDFIFEVGLNPPLRHRPSFDLTAEDTTDDNIIAAYSIATMSDGTRSYEVMRRFEIDKIRQTSQTGALGQTVKFGKDKGAAIAPKGPWVDWFAEMAKKSVMRRHSKTLPMTGDLMIDVEGREIEESSNTALALNSTAPDAPAAIEDQSGEDHDEETGEIIDASARQEAASAQDGGEGSEGAAGEEGSTAPAKAGKKADGQGSFSNERPGDAVAKKPTKAKEEPANGEATSETESGPAGGEAANGEAAGDDEDASDEEHPAVAAADRIKAEIRDANSIVDVNSIYSRHQKDVEAMPPEIGASVSIVADQRKNEIKAAHEEAKRQEGEQ